MESNDTPGEEEVLVLEKEMRKTFSRIFRVLKINHIT
jgi:hypothetical protein